MVKECKWFNIEDKLVVLVSKEYSKAVIRYSNIVYHNGELKKYYNKLYHNNPCEFYRQYVDHKVLDIEASYEDINGEFILQLYKKGRFNF